MAVRMNLTEFPVHGRVVAWKGSYGWLQAQCDIVHPDVTKHGGLIFVHAEDTVPKWTPPNVGALVEFDLYHDGEGLGAQNCVARKVIRLTLPWADAQEMFGEEGEWFPDFETQMGVTVRAYEWVRIDGSSSDLPFIFIEVWGRPDSVIEAVLTCTGSTTRSSDWNCELLVPETRVWMLDLNRLHKRCKYPAYLSDVPTITDPMPFRSLTLRGSRGECGATLRELMLQVCD
mmetsp:Transcript_2341/g.6757  ORF Transcript_2341/g.6757 Transcript_2341/m.6757 type:complete len:230 (-) Transcript_2341:178-867(-)